MREDGDAGEPLFTDAEPALHRPVVVRGLQRPVVGGRRGEFPGVDIGAGVGHVQRCVSSLRQSIIRLCSLRDLAEGPHGGLPKVEVAVMTCDDELGLTRARGRVLQDGVLGRRPVRLVQ